MMVALAFLIHNPGHASMDTSVQLYEAKKGMSLSWNPPLMSALLRWLGGGKQSMQLIIAIDCFLTYVPLSLLAFVLINNEVPANQEISLVTFFFCILLIINPVIFLYVGIVWKDVLFASLLSASAALSIVSVYMSVIRQTFIILISILLLVIASQVRQQGIFMAPLLMGLPLIVLFFSNEIGFKVKLLLSISSLLIFFVLFFMLQALVNETIIGSNGMSNTSGYKIIMNYDIAGVVAMSDTETKDLPITISALERNEIRKYYSSDRVDYLAQSAIASKWLEFSDDNRKKVWLSLLFRETKAFIKHKINVYFSLLDINGVENASPVFTGVNGNLEYLRLVGVESRLSGNDVFLYDLGKKFTGTPIFRHWFYLLISLLGVIATLSCNISNKFKYLLLALGFAIISFYFSYLPTSISSDFRYLYPAILLVTIFWIILIIHVNKSKDY